MLSWCSFCQQLIDEIPPYEDFSITHGMCAACAVNEKALIESDVSHALMLRDVQARLFEAGRRGDLIEAERIIEVCHVDILIGLIAPNLYKIGEDWKRGAVTVADEHRFTSFSERVFEIIANKIFSELPDGVEQTEQADILLINAPGNRHTLGIRILALWLLSKGASAHPVVRFLNVEEILTLVRTRRPRYLLISMALAEQRESVVTIAARVAALPANARPKIIVGGNAVKLGFVRDIPSCAFITDLRGMTRLILEK